MFGGSKPAGAGGSGRKVPTGWPGAMAETEAVPLGGGRAPVGARVASMAAGSRSTRWAWRDTTRAPALTQSSRSTMPAGSMQRSSCSDEVSGPMGPAGGSRKRYTWQARPATVPGPRSWARPLRAASPTTPSRSWSSVPRLGWRAETSWIPLGERE